jgi:hypothetical protein
MGWVLRLVETGTEGSVRNVDVVEIIRPADLGDLADLGLTIADGKQLLNQVQQAVVAAQSRDHAARRPACRTCATLCQVKDYRPHRIATLFGLATLRLPRFRCAGCRGMEDGVDWPSHCRSTPELDQLRAHLSALMPALSPAVLNWADVGDCMVFRGQWAEVWRRPALPEGRPRRGRSRRW